MQDSTKIRVCSKILQEPQVFDRLGDLAGGIARDLVLWAAWNNSELATMHLGQFAKMFGYNRQHLLRKVLPAHLARLQERGWHPDDAAELNNSLGYALGILAVQPLIFRTEKAAKVSASGQLTPASSKTQFIPTISEVYFNKHASGTVIRFKLDPQLLQRCKTVYQSISLNDYLTLKTPGGHPDDQARKLYLRMAWKRRLWDKATVAPGVKPSLDSYEQLKAVCGLVFKDEAKNACLLRALLKRVGELGSVKLGAEVTLNKDTRQYKVKLKKEELAVA
jgi:hypothetical protein